MQLSPVDCPDLLSGWQTAPLGELWRWPLPHQSHSRLNRVLNRLVVAGIRSRIEEITGIEHIAVERGAFIVASNHVCRRDAVYLPATLLIARGGMPVHFLADWNFKLIPGVASIYARAGAITVSRKPARPPFLNVFRSMLGGDKEPMEAARETLEKGRPIGLFPEGTTNRNPASLLRGRFGCARLSLETGTPVVPVGIRYPGHDGSAKKPIGAPIRIHFGPSMFPPESLPGQRASLPMVRAWHAEIMQAIATRCAKPWSGADRFHTSTSRGDTS